MTARRRRPTATCNIGRYRMTVRGPVSVTVAAVRSVVGTGFAIDYDSRSHALAVKVEHAHDVIAALEQAGARVVVHGDVPEQALW